MIFTSSTPEPMLQQDDRAWENGCVTLLTNALRAKGKLQTLNLPHWLDEFSKLSRSANGEDLRPRIDHVLQWYVAHLGEEFVPLALSASSFRKKFHQIATQADKDISFETISPEAKDLKRRLLTMSALWNPDLTMNLGQIIEQSLRNYSPFYSTFLTAKQKWEQHHVHDDFVGANFRLARALESSSFICLPYWFVQRWICEVGEDSKWRTGGSPLAWAVFTATHDKFKQLGRAEATRYSGDPGRFDKLLDGIAKC